MNSSLFDCHVFHERLLPRRHRFSYRIFLLSIDLDELPILHTRSAFFSVNDQNVLSLNERDYLPLSNGTRAPQPLRLKDRVTTFLARHGVIAPKRVQLVTLPRLFGYAFNPVSFYFCFDGNGAPCAAIAEVTNTFGEMKPFFLGPDTLIPGNAGEPSVFFLRVPKWFYVSPFSDVDVEFEFRLPVPDATLRLHIDDYEGKNQTLLSRLYGAAKPFDDGTLLRYCATFPFMTLGVIAGIHWHALRLWLKGLRWFAKGARPDSQRDLFRPHTTLSSNKV